ncbi:hypothetical protein HYS28_00750, partial [Candidatus Uhrbacteria bacterium]|nr:hypothetical protein [Candidatus Uhrbacteria bacterium]
AVVSLGTIAAGARGSIHLKGVMFGDVGGEQAFTSTLTFVHGDARDVPSSKTVTHTFSPASSTLELTLSLPENLIAYQPIAGTITYRNTGEIAVPAVTIEPAWPEGFTFTASDTQRAGGAFVLPAIEPGEQGAIRFEGFLGDVRDQIVFTFYPSFTFGQDSYRQETLVHAAPILPPQLSIAHGLSSASVTPGEEIVFTIRYENVGQDRLTDIVLGIESDSPFFSKRTYEVNSATFPELAVVAPGATGEIQIPVRLRPAILQSETDVWEHLDLTTRPTASYALGDSEERVSSKGSSLASPITTPVTLTSFGRYAMPSGDQLGRGPLPPRVGEKTTYWVFWRVGGTINELTNVRLEGTLGDNVSFTGRQSSSQNSGVALDEAAGLIRWKLES